MSRIKEDPGQLRLVCCPEEAASMADFAVAIGNLHREKGTAPKTIRTVRQVFRILASLDVRTTADLADPDLTRRFAEHTERKGWADSTRDLLQRHLHCILRRAHELGILVSPPLLPPLPKPGGRSWQQNHAPTTRHLPPLMADVWRLVHGLEEWLLTRAYPWSVLRLYVLVMIILETGIPFAAALRLTPGDIAPFWHRRIRYFPRRGRACYALMTPRLEAVLALWLEHCGPRWLFPDRSKLVPWCRVSGQVGAHHRALAAACRVAGIKPITFEQLRRFHEQYAPIGMGPSPGVAAIDFGIANPPPIDAADFVSLTHRLGRRIPRPLAFGPADQPREVDPTAVCPAAPRTEYPPTADPAGLVTLSQAAGMVHKAKRTLERCKTKGKLPDPAVEGGGGKPDLYDWKVMRPWLESEYGMKLPEAFPADG